MRAATALGVAAGVAGTGSLVLAGWLKTAFAEASRVRRSVALVGAGEIVRAAHLPSYIQLGLEIRGIWDLNPERGEELARSVGVPALDSLEALLDDVDTLVVDVAVPPEEQPAILYQVFAAGKHALAQKPLAPTLDEATNLVDAAREAGVLLAVNQQMRWEPAIVTCYRLLTAGRLGRVKGATFTLKRPMIGASLPSWVASAPRLTVLLNSIHFIDSCRFLFGEPLALSCHTWKHEGFGVVGETGAELKITFADDISVSIVDELVSPRDPLVATFQLLASNAIVDASLGLWVDYPKGAPDQIEVTWASGRVEDLGAGERWLPDAFKGPISELFAAIEERRSPTIDGADHLRTLRIVEAAYISASRAIPVELRA
ncbi:MAG: Gfo/Idh/MocA family oxidoreductase [Thermoleophilia bacterium]|nr:Gfo/Idh/MocA family oxidoreductase [Thermoleophilia bacterium]